ncbi:CBS domain-containing protein [Paracoccus hibiscisoli]|uniref:CBS domain-containing protein n=2 Tax=Paracoccus hibiscisoli TaxID=2023261 RepID=A0A4U0QJU6_9RHOB|nr:CBS domain-containing protein [Paracoccus hibiscisoli]
MRHSQGALRRRDMGQRIHQTTARRQTDPAALGSDMDTSTTRFIRIFEALKTEINKAARAEDSERLELDRAAKATGVVYRNLQRLRYIRDIRNLLQHPQHKSTQPAVSITESFLAEVEDLLNQLQNPPRAGTLGVPRGQLSVASPDDKIGDLAGKILRDGFSHLPILDEDDRVIGVFNEAAVFAHLWAEDITLIGRDMTVSELMESCRLGANHTETFDFVAPRTPQENIAKMFSTVRNNKTRVGAVFVTASGNRHEPLQRMITPWDVLAKFRHS